MLSFLFSNVGCLSTLGTNVTANNSTNNNVVFFISDLKIVYNNYQSLITMPWTKEEKMEKNDLKLFKQHFVGSLT